jgi:hypothetical protein
MFEALRGLFSKPEPAAAPVEATAPAVPGPIIRPSLALEQFFDQLQQRENLRVLDLSGASQANLNFVLQFGHHLYCEDAAETLVSVFGNGPDFYARQESGELMEEFLSQTFAALEGPFDGALLWDTLQFLTPPLVDHAVGHLHRLLEPGAHLYASFCADEKCRALTISHHRIESRGSIRLIPRAQIPGLRFYTTRAIERLFSDFAQVKFFLTREGMREVLIRR